MRGHGSADVANVATPELSVALPMTVVPSMKLTDPVGVPEPGATADTVAVNVTLCPATDGLADDFSTVIVVSLATD